MGPHRQRRPNRNTWRREAASILAAGAAVVNRTTPSSATSLNRQPLSEQAGFSTARFAEHHFNNYSGPPPLLMVTHCAGLTTTIRLATAVLKNGSMFRSQFCASDAFEIVGKFVGSATQACFWIGYFSWSKWL